ncbi:hypothetical protein CIHG_02638 [Coccidioides immitis H538.4]|uniref:Uncharacterized protein n=1 Tax=Coccidioides immitis H538.4 TaxID=396776 RepID=A0A0J8UCA6_COCIT|nr:hypothetical protein CIHG_02638 [Coccidioides immitis H538.4]
MTGGWELTVFLLLLLVSPCSSLWASGRKLTAFDDDEWVTGSPPSPALNAARTQAASLQAPTRVSGLKWISDSLGPSVFPGFSARPGTNSSLANDRNAAPRSGVWIGSCDLRSRQAEEDLGPMLAGVGLWDEMN